MGQELIEKAHVEKPEGKKIYLAWAHLQAQLPLKVSLPLNPMALPFRSVEWTLPSGIKD